MAPILRFGASTALSLLGIAAGAGPLASNSGPLANYSGHVILLGCLAGLLVFLYLAGKERWRLSVLAQGVLAAVVLPAAIALAPFLMCVFITHGTCS
jgi:hypothetical protein